MAANRRVASWRRKTTLFKIMRHGLERIMVLHKQIWYMEGKLSRKDNQLSYILFLQETFQGSKRTKIPQVCLCFEILTELCTLLLLLFAFRKNFWWNTTYFKNGTQLCYINKSRLFLKRHELNSCVYFWCVLTFVRKWKTLPKNKYTSFYMQQSLDSLQNFSPLVDFCPVVFFCFVTRLPSMLAK